MWKNRGSTNNNNKNILSKISRKRGRHNTGAAGGPVGTEAKALANLKSNAKKFKYPEEGFVTKIEYSLLYSMISEPDTYPEEVVKKFIEEEEFEKYLFVDSTFSSSQKPQEETERVSYAQLSAILSLSAEKVPKLNTTTNKNKSNKDVTEQHYHQPQQSISEKLCKLILKCIVRYAEQNDLDRETELKELLTPVQKVAQDRLDKREMRGLLILYGGYGAALLTGNILPLIASAGMTIAKDAEARHERENVRSIVTQTDRVADIETAGLLDEGEDF